MVFTHGHIDHVFGLAPFEQEAEANGWAPPHVVAHELLPARFERYVLTAGYNGVINQRQFQFAAPFWPTEYRHPDELYRDHHTLEVGGETWELHHDKGETDDATWVWNPGRKVLCTGDLFIWASPNCGNPQKVQRYPREWAIGLRKMAALGAEVLLPGPRLPDPRRRPHPPGPRRHRRAARIAGRADPGADERGGPARRHRPHGGGAGPPARQAVPASPSTTSRSSWCATSGGSTAAGTTATRPTSSPPRRPPWRPSWPTLAGGAGRLAERAQELAAAGDLRLAGHLAEMAAQAAPDDPGVHAARAEVFARRAAEERSTMSKGVFSWAERESRDRIGLYELTGRQRPGRPGRGAGRHR